MLLGADSTYVLFFGREERGDEGKIMPVPASDGEFLKLLGDMLGEAATGWAVSSLHQELHLTAGSRVMGRRWVYQW